MKRCRKTGLPRGEKPNLQTLSKWHLGVKPVPAPQHVLQQPRCSRGERPWVPGTPGASGDLLRFKEKKWYQKRKIKINNSILEKWSQVINPTLHRSSPAQPPLSAATGLLSSLGFKWILKEAGAAWAGGHHSPYYSALPCPETLVPCSNIPQTKRNICQIFQQLFQQAFASRCGTSTHLDPLLWNHFF